MYNRKHELVQYKISMQKESFRGRKTTFLCFFIRSLLISFQSFFLLDSTWLYYDLLREIEASDVDGKNYKILPNIWWKAIVISEINVNQKWSSWNEIEFFILKYEIPHSIFGDLNRQKWRLEIKGIFKRLQTGFPWKIDDPKFSFSSRRKERLSFVVHQVFFTLFSVFIDDHSRHATHLTSLNKQNRTRNVFSPPGLFFAC